MLYHVWMILKYHTLGCMIPQELKFHGYIHWWEPGLLLSKEEMVNFLVGYKTDKDQMISGWLDSSIHKDSLPLWNKKLLDVTKAVVEEVDSVVEDNKKHGLWMKLSSILSHQKRSLRKLVIQRLKVFISTVCSFKPPNGLKDLLMNLKKNKCIHHSHLFILVLKKLKKDKDKKIDHKHLNVLFININVEQIYI